MHCVGSECAIKHIKHYLNVFLLMIRLVSFLSDSRMTTDLQLADYAILRPIYIVYNIYW